MQCLEIQERGGLMENKSSKYDGLMMMLEKRIDNEYHINEGKMKTLRG